MAALADVTQLVHEQLKIFLAVGKVDGSRVDDDQRRSLVVVKEARVCAHQPLQVLGIDLLLVFDAPAGDALL